MVGCCDITLAAFPCGVDGYVCLLALFAIYKVMSLAPSKHSKTTENQSSHDDPLLPMRFSADFLAPYARYTGFIFLQPGLCLLQFDYLIVKYIVLR